VKTARGRRTSSTRWLQRQLNDPYVRAAKNEGFRGRAAFKLIELDDQFGLLRTGTVVLDLGAAPGGWSQVAAARTGADRGTKGRVVAVDLQEMDALNGVVCLHIDIFDEAAPDLIKSALGAGADVVLSDMAAPATGHRQTDHLRVIALADAAYEIAREVLKPGGHFVAKVFQGGTEGELLARLKREFRSVRHAKPPASRKESPEVYVIAMDFRP
jgi:23S rRNA (uridine2552-2'-O)-methyltransferase